MSKLLTRSLFDGKPITYERADKNGNIIITVKANAIGPKMAQLADWLSYGVAAATGIISIGDAIMLSEASPIQRGLMVCAAIPAFYAAKHVFYNLLSRTKPVRCTQETTSFRKGLRMQHFDTNLPCKWVVNENPKAGLEKRKFEVKKEKRKFKKSFIYFKPTQEPYYENSRVISLEYAGQRNDFITTNTLEAAQVIVSRLTAVSDVISGRSYGNGGIETSLEEAWGRKKSGLIIAHERSES